MQQNIQKSMAKANKERSQTNKAERKKNSKKRRSKSNLLRMLSSNIVSENTAVNSRSNIEANLPSGTSPITRSYPTNVEVASAPVPQPLQLQGQELSPSNKPPTRSPTKPCPLCGSSIKLELFDQHMQEELIALAAIDDDDDSGWEQLPLPLTSSLQNQHQQRPAPLLPSAPLDPKVFILGGTPAMAVPRNPKKLKPLPPEFRRQIKPVRAYNYYADGGGNMDGDEIGLDGFENVGVGWEGVGATTF